MTAFDATKPTIDARDESISDTMSRFRNADDGASTRLPRCASSGARSAGGLRDAAEGDGRQVFPAAAMLDDQLHDGTGSPSHERVWLRTRRATQRLTRVGSLGRYGAMITTPLRRKNVFET